MAWGGERNPVGFKWYGEKIWKMSCFFLFESVRSIHSRWGWWCGQTPHADIGIMGINELDQLAIFGFQFGDANPQLHNSGQQIRILLLLFYPGPPGCHSVALATRLYSQFIFKTEGRIHGRHSIKNGCGRCGAFFFAINTCAKKIEGTLPLKKRPRLGFFGPRSFCALFYA